MQWDRSVATTMEDQKTKAEALRYLGRREQAVPPELDALVDECLVAMRTASTFRWVTAEFALCEADGALRLEGAGLDLPGEAVRQHLSGCGRAVLLAATLGTGAEALIRRWERADLTRALVLDACATALVEEGCDRVEAGLRAAAGTRGQGLTGRFSPGYGDLPLALQPGLLAAVDAGRRIGLTCTDSLILLPRKSVTAVLGLGAAARRAAGGCAACAWREHCTFRKEAGADGCPGEAR